MVDFIRIFNLNQYPNEERVYCLINIIESYFDEIKGKINDFILNFDESKYIKDKQLLYDLYILMCHYSFLTNDADRYGYFISKIDNFEYDEKILEQYMHFQFITANKFCDVKDFDTSTFCFERLIQLCQEIGNEELLNLCYRDAVNPLNVINESKKALEYSLRLCQYYKETEDYAFRTCYYNAGITYFCLEEYAKAFIYLNRSSDLFKKLKDDNLLFCNYYYIGNLYMILKEYKKAKEILLIAKNLDYFDKNQEKYSEILFMLNDVYLEENQPQKSLEILHEIEGFILGAKLFFAFLTCQSRFVETYVILKDYKTAMIYADKAEKLSYKTKDAYTINYHKIIKTEIYYYLKDYKKAKKRLTNICVTALMHNFKDIEEKCRSLEEKLNDKFKNP